jgi:hypothetical protein
MHVKSLQIVLGHPQFLPPRLPRELCETGLGVFGVVVDKVFDCYREGVSLFIRLVQKDLF